jgi:2-(1,2-epoxy-1,2-dihydrophenyl)acetyl-CoA isomerase
MKATIIGSDLLQKNDSVKFLEINTNTTIYNEGADLLDYTSLFDMLTTNNITQFHFIWTEGDSYKPLTEQFRFKKILEEHYNPIITRIRAIEKPMIAAVNGVAAGAGANIALACDIVVASEKASFIQAFSKIGLVPDSAGSFFLPRLIGFQKASALMLLGDKVSAAQAQDLGMIYKVFPPETFLQEVHSLALHMAQLPTKALGLTKKLLNASFNNTLEQQLALESKLQIQAANSNDYKEGVSAFVEKRKPNFKGN